MKFVTLRRVLQCRQLFIGFYVRDFWKDRRMCYNQAVHASHCISLVV